MKKRIFGLLLAFVLLFALAAPAYAEQGRICEAFVNPFTDVRPDDPFYEDVMDAAARDLMQGAAPDRFDPHGVMTRAMLAVILWCLEGEPVVNYAMRFRDVSQDAWYAEAVRWAASTGIAAGYSDEVFAPDDSVTREQTAAMLYRYEQHKGGGFQGLWMFNLKFSDKEEISGWAYEAVCWMSSKGVIPGGGDGLLDPKGAVERCEAAGILCRFCPTDAA